MGAPSIRFVFRGTLLTNVLQEEGVPPSLVCIYAVLLTRCAGRVLGLEGALEAALGPPLLKKQGPGVDAIHICGGRIRASERVNERHYIIAAQFLLGVGARDMFEEMFYEKGY